MKNKNYVYNMWVFTFIWGTHNVVGNLLTPLFGKQFSPTQISLIGCAFIVCGIGGTAIVGIIIDKTKQHLLVIRVTTCVCSVGFFLMMWIIPSGNMFLTVTLSGILGTVMNSILPAGFSFSVYLTHPLPPAVSCGLLMAVSQLYTILMSIIGAALLENN